VTKQQPGGTAVVVVGSHTVVNPLTRPRSQWDGTFVLH